MDSHNHPSVSVRFICVKPQQPMFSIIYNSMSKTFARESSAIKIKIVRYLTLYVNFVLFLVEICTFPCTFCGLRMNRMFVYCVYRPLAYCVRFNTLTLYTIYHSHPHPIPHPYPTPTGNCVLKRGGGHRQIKYRILIYLEAVDCVERLFHKDDKVIYIN